MASMVTIAPQNSTSSRTSGMAMISLLFFATPTLAVLSFCETAQTPTMCESDLAVAVSNLWRAVLPSMIREAIGVGVVQSGRPVEEAPLEFGRFQAAEDHVETVKRGNAVEEVEEPAESVLVHVGAFGHGHELVNAGNSGTQGMATMLMSRWVTLPRRGSVSAAKCGRCMATGWRSSGSKSGSSRFSAVGPFAFACRVARPSSSQITHYGVIALPLSHLPTTEPHSLQQAITNTTPRGSPPPASADYPEDRARLTCLRMA